MPDIFAKAAHVLGSKHMKAFAFYCTLPLLWASPADAYAAAPPNPPTNVVAEDVTMDGGGVITVNWTASDSDGVTGYELWRSETDKESLDRQKGEHKEALDSALSEAYANEYSRLVDVEGVSPEDAAVQARAVARDAVRNADSIGAPTEYGPYSRYWVLVDSFGPETSSAEVDNLSPTEGYAFLVYA